MNEKLINLIEKMGNCLYQDQEILDATWKNTNAFIPPITSGKVIKVYDGDTITIASKINKIKYRFSVRLLGIDSPEIKGKSTKEKELAIISRDKLSELIMDKMIRLENLSTEKYGRILADVYIGTLHVNKFMLDNGYAVPYDGKTKKSLY